MGVCAHSHPSVCTWHVRVCPGVRVSSPWGQEEEAGTERFGLWRLWICGTLTPPFAPGIHGRDAQSAQTPQAVLLDHVEVGERTRGGLIGKIPPREPQEAPVGAQSRVLACWGLRLQGARPSPEKAPSARARSCGLRIRVTYPWETGGEGASRWGAYPPRPQLRCSRIQCIRRLFTRVLRRAPVVPANPWVGRRGLGRPRAGLNILGPWGSGETEDGAENLPDAGGQDGEDALEDEEAFSG